MEERISEDLPPQWKKEVEGLNRDDAATHYSMYRTEMSTHRTILSNARSHMANERTHLAYLRTSLSLMSFGITLNRFSIYLREGKMAPVKVPGLLYETEIIGIGIVVVGLVVLCWALYRYRQVN